MTQVITGPDGVEHEFPDDTSDDVIKKTLQQNYGTPTGTNTATPTPTDQSSFTSRLLSGLGQVGQNTDDDMRLFGRGFTGGLGDRVLGGPDAVKATNDASTRQGWAGTIPETLGMVANPVQDIVGVAKAGKIATAASEGAIQSGVQSYSQGNSPGQIALDTLKGSGISAVAQPIAKVLTTGAKKLANTLPDWITGADTPPVPTSADLRAGPGFKPASTYQSADVLDDFAEMQRKAAVKGGPSLQSQVTGYLTNPDTASNLTKPQYDALSDVGPPVVSGFLAKHPFLTGHAIGDIPAVLGVEQLMHGEPGAAALSAALGIGAHIGGYTIPKMLANRGTQNAFDEASRSIGGTPSSPSTVSQYLSNPATADALRRLIFGGYQSSPQ